MTKPVVYSYDIETGFNVATIFQLFNHRPISHDAIIQERYIISASFKMLGEGKVFAVSLLDDMDRFNKDPTDDYYVCKRIYEILSGADGVIAHYGDGFDMKFINTRLLYHGFPPLPPIIQIDTYKIARKKFLFNNNRLDYIGKYLGLGEKIKTEQTLWLRCLNGEKKAVREMVKYNKQDVELLEKVYKALAPFVPAVINRALFFEDEVCPLCGSPNIQYQGYRYTRTRKYRRLFCKSCNHWSQSSRCVENTTAKVK